MHAKPTPVTSANTRPHTHGDPAERNRTKLWVALVVGLLVLVGFVNGLMAFLDDGPPPIEGLVRVDGLVDEIVTGPIAYTRYPPAGGPHAALMQVCGYYRVPVRDEHAVASLATGAVWIAYSPELPSDDVKALRRIAEGELDVIFAPYPGLDHAVVLTAWGTQLPLDDARDPRIQRFVDEFQNGDQAPNVDADCRTGIGVP